MNGKSNRRCARQGVTPRLKASFEAAGERTPGSLYPERLLAAARMRGGTRVCGIGLRRRRAQLARHVCIIYGRTGRASEWFIRGIRLMRVTASLRGYGGEFLQRGRQPARGILTRGCFAACFLTARAVVCCINCGWYRGINILICLLSSL